MPHPMDENGEVRWDQVGSDDLTMRQWKEKLEAEMVAEKGQAWVDERKAALDAEFVEIVNAGLLT